MVLMPTVKNDDPALINLSQMIESKGLLQAADSVELHIYHRTPSGMVFLIRPGTMAHWFGGIDRDTIAVVVNPDSREPSQHALDYLLEGIDYEEIDRSDRSTPKEVPHD